MSFEGNPLTFGLKVSSQKTVVFGAALSEDFVIVACTVLIKLQSVTDRRTDAEAIAKTCESLCCRA